ncbi:MAG: glycosyltransferase [Candidatus Pacearchaeota archaeon]|nr:glycosyltransferase [Candidatus Pacearchaeota archaeon]
MISIVLSSFHTSKLLKKAIDAVLGNKIKEKYELVVIDSDKNIREIIKQSDKKYSKIKFFDDKGKGKSYSLNLIFKMLKGDIWIFSEGDSFIANNSINEIIESFRDESVGCVSGRPISLNSRKKILGYWSHLLFDAAHKIRKELDAKELFLECSGYLFAFRDNITKNIPLNVADDSIIPYLVTKKGYKVKYAEKAVVYVGNPQEIRTFINQKVDAAKAHEALEDYAPFFPKVKSFTNEVKKGTFLALAYPKNAKEFSWTILLFFTRLYIWIKVKWEEKIIKKKRKGFL